MEIIYTAKLLFSLPNLIVSNQAVLWSVLNWWKEWKQELYLGFVNAADIWGPDWMIYLNSFLYASLIGREEKWLINAGGVIKDTRATAFNLSIKKSPAISRLLTQWQRLTGIYLCWLKPACGFHRMICVNVIIVYEKLLSLRWHMLKDIISN